MYFYLYKKLLTGKVFQCELMDFAQNFTSIRICLNVAIILKTATKLNQKVTKAYLITEFSFQKDTLSPNGKFCILNYIDFNEYKIFHFE